MLANQAIKKNKYTRPAYAKNYLQLSDVLLSEQAHQREMILEVPPINNMLPLNGYNHYGEATSEGVAVEGRVVCSGSIIPIYNSAGTSIIGIGISKYDAKPGDKVACIVEGDVLMPCGINIIATGLTDAHAGAAAYFNGSQTLSTALSNVRIGEFLAVEKVNARASLIPNYGSKGWAPVRLSQHPDTSLTKPAANVFSAFTGTLVLQVGISGFTGVEQNVFVDAKLNNPNETILPEDVKVDYDGTEFAPTSGYTIPVVFAAGIGEAFDVVVEKTLSDGTSINESVSFEIDISASAAPASFTEA